MTNQMRCAAGLVTLTLLSGVAAGAGINEMLLAAIRDGNAARIRTALQQGAAPKARDLYGTPALMQAALYADAACLALLEQV